MVSEFAKWALVNTNIDPHKIAVVWGIDENECWQYLDDLNRALREAENQRDATELKKEVKEWVETIPDKNNIRIEAIREQLIDAKTSPEKHDISRLLCEVKILKGTSESVTKEMIERARQYPMENLIELKRKMALCPFHNEKTSSFSVKNNSYHCFGCGVSGDTIDLTMHLKNYTFRQAVESLQ